MRSKRSILLIIGLALAAIGCVLIANPFEHEPVWAQWGLGFALFYLGLPLAMLGAAIYFIGYAGPKDPFSPPAQSLENRNRLSENGRPRP